MPACRMARSVPRNEPRWTAFVPRRHLRHLHRGAAPLAVVRLRQVDQLEVVGEGARQLVSIGQIQLPHARHLLLQKLCCACRISLRCGLAALNRELPQIFFQVKQPLAGLFSQHLAQQHAERPDIAAQRHFL